MCLFQRYAGPLPAFFALKNTLAHKFPLVLLRPCLCILWGRSNSGGLFINSKSLFGGLDA